MLKVKGATGGSGKMPQGIQGMSKGPATSGMSPSGKAVMKQGVAAKDSQKMPKSSKKKVIVDSLLKMMSKGHLSKMMSGKGGTNKGTGFGD